MIVLDSTETRSGTRMPFLRGATESSILEAVTGADCMVTLLKFPMSTESLIRCHVALGAILIQRKSVCDLISSILDEGINRSLARMLECGAKHQYQRVILSTGYLSPMSVGIVGVGTMTGHNPSGTPKIQWSRCNPEVQYESFATIRWRIACRGGYYLPLISDDEIPLALKVIERDLKYMSKRPTKELMHLESFPPDPPAPDDPLQEVIEVKDGRLVVASLKHIGPKKTNALWSAIWEWNIINRPLDMGFTLSLIHI